jgi:photosystem II stability/assembly factor-like uncharacterized protein
MLRIIIAEALTFFILFAAHHHVYSQQYWVRQNSPVTRWLTNLDFVDSVYGWAAGDSGAIVATTNGGITWTLQQTGIDYMIEELQFINRQVGYGIANAYYLQGTTILKTTNGGINWTYSRFPDTTLIINTLYFLNEQTGFLGGYMGLILKTTNGGGIWKRMNIDTAWGCEFPIWKFNFRNIQYGYASGGIMEVGGVLWRTTDYGSNWQCELVTWDPMLDIYIVDSLRALAIGGDFEFGTGYAKTYNNGVNWSYHNLAFFGQGQALTARTQSEIWAPLGFSVLWAVSLDTGNTWMEIPGPDSAGIWDAEFVSPYCGWACGTWGTIYRYNPSVIGIQDPSSSAFFSLSQNYPNPFNPKTTIKFQLSIPADVKLAIYDLQGKLVKIVLDELRFAGENNVEVDMSEYASGLYLYKLETNSFSRTKKMLLIK